MTGYRIVSSVSYDLEICPKCNTKNLIKLEVIIEAIPAEEWKDKPDIIKKCLKCEPEIKKDIII